MEKPNLQGVARVFFNDDFGHEGSVAGWKLFDKLPSEDEMRADACNTSLPAIAFLSVQQNAEIDVRWYSGSGPIILCGHGAAAVAFALGQILDRDHGTMHFSKGKIAFSFQKGEVRLTFDQILSTEKPIPEALQKACSEVIAGFYWNENKPIVLLESEAAVRRLTLDHHILENEADFGYVFTALDHTPFDFCSRTLLPKLGYKEDPATGSSHVILASFWASRLGKVKLIARQLSPQGAYFRCQLRETKVELRGFAQAL